MVALNILYRHPGKLYWCCVQSYIYDTRTHTYNTKHCRILHTPLLSLRHFDIDRPGRRRRHSQYRTQIMFSESHWIIEDMFCVCVFHRNSPHRFLRACICRHNIVGGELRRRRSILLGEDLERDKVVRCG